MASVCAGSKCVTAYFSPARYAFGLGPLGATPRAAPTSPCSLAGSTSSGGGGGGASSSRVGSVGAASASCASGGLGSSCGVLLQATVPSRDRHTRYSELLNMFTSPESPELPRLARRW